MFSIIRVRVIKENFHIIQVFDMMKILKSGKNYCQFFFLML